MKIFLFLLICSYSYANNPEDLKVITNSITWGDPNFVMEIGDTASIHYEIRDLKTNKLYWDSKKRERPFVMVYGNEEMLPCWKDALIDLKLSETRTFNCPSALGYGKVGFKDKIPPNTDLRFEIQLKSLQKSTRYKEKMSKLSKEKKRKEEI